MKLAYEIADQLQDNLQAFGDTKTNTKAIAIKLLREMADREAVMFKLAEELARHGEQRFAEVLGVESPKEDLFADTQEGDRFEPKTYMFPVESEAFKITTGYKPMTVISVTAQMTKLLTDEGKLVRILRTQRSYSKALSAFYQKVGTLSPAIAIARYDKQNLFKMQGN